MAEHCDDSMFTRLLRWNAGETPGPRRITLFPTNRCNLRCRICWQRGAEGLENTEETSPERLLELVDEAADMGVRDWVIIGGGEPLIRADVVNAMCERIRKRGMNGVLQTNGTLLKPEIIENLIDIGWSRINISLDGPTREINDAIRSEGSFEKATNNIRLLNEVKRKKNADTPIVGLYAVITATNYDKIDQMVELARELECAAGVMLTTMVLHSEEGAEFKLKEEHKLALPDHVLKATQLAGNYSMPNNFDLYMQESIIQNPNAMVCQRPKSDGKDLVNSMCFEPWLSVAITAEGVVGPCCAFWDPTAQSIQKVSLQEAWMGGYMRDLRLRLVENRLPAYCSRCPSILFAQSETLRTQLQWELMSKHERGLHIVRKAMNSIKRHGARRAFGRGIEWVQIRMSRR